MDVRPDPLLADLLEEHDLDRSSVEELYHLTRGLVTAEVDELAEALASGDQRTVLPEIDHDELATLDDSQLALIRRRGCVVVRGTFTRDQATEWNDELGAYLAANRYVDRLTEREPQRAATGSGISPIFWSASQIAARQHPRMVEVRTFLNSLWIADADGDRPFDPAHDIGYADRVRWRPPGATAVGLPLHCDSPVTGGWHDPENHLTYRSVLAGRPERYDPWDATHRVALSTYSACPADVFRTFQGWTALTDTQPADGTLRIVPIPLFTPHLLVRGIAMELGVFGEPTAAPIRMRGSSTAEPAAVRVPAMAPGDTVWWHSDLLHGVDEAANDARWSNVMYIGSSPRCPRNDAYNASMRAWFEAGDSPSDFNERHYERDFVGRATVGDLNAVGRQQLGYDPVG